MQQTITSKAPAPAWARDLIRQEVLRLEPAELKQIAGNQQPRKNKFAGKHNMARVAREANGMPEHAITARLEAMVGPARGGKSTEALYYKLPALLRRLKRTGHYSGTWQEFCGVYVTSKPRTPKAFGIRCNNDNTKVLSRRSNKTC
jgi:hypothetical protein